MKFLPNFRFKSLFECLRAMNADPWNRISYFFDDYYTGNEIDFSDNLDFNENLDFIDNFDFNENLDLSFISYQESLFDLDYVGEMDFIQLDPITENDEFYSMEEIHIVSDSED